jgi:hypothetical protein
MSLGPDILRNERGRLERTARNLLIEFIGGEPGEMLRGQFA